MAQMEGEYPAVPGNKPISITDQLGPASYTVITTGSPPTGGQTINASAFGLQFLENVWAMGSDDGQYVINVFMNPLYKNQPSTSVLLQWIVAATGAEVTGTTDLSGRTVRLMAIGR